jgi:hypothetical protein
MPPGEVLRLADFKPCDIHDALPSDTKFKILVFCGNINDQAQKMKLNSLALALEDQNGSLFPLTRRSGGISDTSSMISLITIRRVNLHPNRCQIHLGLAVLPPPKMLTYGKSLVVYVLTGKRKLLANAYST